MRALAVVLLLGASACEINDSAAAAHKKSPPPAAKNDLAVAAVKPAPPPPPPPDLAPPEEGLSCTGVQGCMEKCKGPVAQCGHECAQKVRRSSRPYYDALAACIKPACAEHPDGTPGPCHEPLSTSCKFCVMSNCGGLATTCLAH